MNTHAWHRERLGLQPSLSYVMNIHKWHASICVYIYIYIYKFHKREHIKNYIFFNEDFIGQDLRIRCQNLIPLREEIPLKNIKRIIVINNVKM
mgnify:CR=1 FL=1